MRVSAFKCDKHETTCMYDYTSEAQSRIEQEKKNQTNGGTMQSMLNIVFYIW